MNGRVSELIENPLSNEAETTQRRRKFLPFITQAAEMCTSSLSFSLLVVRNQATKYVWVYFVKISLFLLENITSHGKRRKLGHNMSKEHALLFCSIVNART